MVATGTKRLGTLAVASGMVLAATAWSHGGDEPTSRLGRLFRLGGSSKGNAPAVGKVAPGPKKPDSPRVPPAELPTGAPYQPLTADSGSSLPAYGALPGSNPAPTPTGSRIAPQPRISRAVTEADPLVTRVSIGRSDDGKQFCMFVQIFADGTILDSEGVHHIGASHLRPIAELLQSGELAKRSGHCGGPASDFIEQVHVVAYDRYRGKLRATSFSYSGNPQGCDPSVRKLNEAIDAIQAKLSGPPPAKPTSVDAAPPTPSPALGAAVPPPPSTPTIGLTPDR